MAESSKTPEMDQQLDLVSSALFGRQRSVALANNFCVVCGGPAKEFLSEVSRKEYSISGMCEPCQDRAFGPGPGYVNQD